MKKTSKFLWVCYFILVVASIIAVINGIAEKTYSEAVWALIALIWLLNFISEVRESDFLKEEINRLDANINELLNDIESHLRHEKEQKETIQKLQDKIKELESSLRIQEKQLGRSQQWTSK